MVLSADSMRCHPEFSGVHRRHRLCSIDDGTDAPPLRHPVTLGLAGRSWKKRERNRSAETNDYFFQRRLVTLLTFSLNGSSDSLGRCNPHVIRGQNLRIGDLGVNPDALKAGPVPRRGQKHEIVLIVEVPLKLFEVRLEADQG